MGLSSRQAEMRMVAMPMGEEEARKNDMEGEGGLSERGRGEICSV